jgi:hypothetical protein
VILGWHAARRFRIEAEVRVPFGADFLAAKRDGSKDGL